MNRRQLSRRDFVRATAFAAVGLAAAKWAQPTAQVIEKEVPVEKVVKETVVVEKQVAVEKVVTATPRVMKYSEAPMLAGLVQEGKLPPVDERLPENPAVVTPHEGIGQYGGTWHRLATSMSDIQTPFRLMGDTLVHWDKDGADIYANMAESWDVSSDGKGFSFTLRKGLKWSDGEPYTADDIMFRYEAMLLNADLTPKFPSNVSPGGEPVKIEKLDDYSLRMTFAVPYPLFILLMATSQPGVEFIESPKHYLAQFHPDYTTDKAALDAMIEDSGFEFWYQLYNAGRQRLVTGDQDKRRSTGDSAWKVTVPPPSSPWSWSATPTIGKWTPRATSSPTSIASST